MKYCGYYDVLLFMMWNYLIIECEYVYKEIVVMGFDVRFFWGDVDEVILIVGVCKFSEWNLVVKVMVFCGGMYVIIYVWF